MKEGEGQLPCLVREIHLKELSKDAASRLCREVLTLLVQTNSVNVVKVLTVACSENNEKPERNQKDARLYIVTEFFVYSIHDLVRYSMHIDIVIDLSGVGRLYK